MAAEVQSADSSEQVIPSRRKESVSEVFMPKDTLDQPCDVVLMVKDGKEFKAHRRVLSESSPFFETLLNSDIKETQEGVVRLEMFTESVMATALQFIYTGDVQILDEDNTRDLMAVADYLFLDKLKLLAEGVLVQTLNISNCISTYYFAERYQCENLLSSTTKFFVANFSSVYAESREDVLNMSSKEIEMWISSDDVDVSAEEDVFKIILAWIDHDRSRRRRYFDELFRHVRLVYVSRDFLRHDIVTNELVQDNGSCLTMAKDAINLLDSKNFERLSVPPRKTLEIPAIVVNAGGNVLCYFPHDNSWCRLGEIPTLFTTTNQGFITCSKFDPCGGQLYLTVQERSHYRPKSLKQVTYNLYSNRCVLLPSVEEPRRYLQRTFVRNGDEMYALMSEPCVMDHLLNWRFSGCRRLGRVSDVFQTEQNCSKRKHTSYLTKYKPESNSWEDISSFDYLDLRQDFCIVAKDNFVYFIGGIEWSGNECTFLADVDRYDVSKNEWDKLPDIQIARKWAHGAAVNEKIYIAGGVFKGSTVPESYQCEMYDETISEWQFIASFRIGHGKFGSLLAVDGELYASCTITNFRESPMKYSVKIVSYNPEENKWDTKTEVTARRATRPFARFGSMRIFKGFFNIRPVDEAFPSDGSPPGACTTQHSLTSKKPDRKCFIM